MRMSLKNDVSEIVSEHLLQNRPVSRLAIQTNALFNVFIGCSVMSISLGSRCESRLRNCGIIDPESIDEYFAMRGYEALAKVLTDMSPQDVVKEIKASGLRGRGVCRVSDGVEMGIDSARTRPCQIRHL